MIVAGSPSENRVPVRSGWGPPHGASNESGHRRKIEKFLFRDPQMGEVVIVACALLLASETSHGGMEPVRVTGQLEPVPATRAPSLAWLETEDQKNANQSALLSFLRGPLVRAGPTPLKDPLPPPFSRAPAAPTRAESGVCRFSRLRGARAWRGLPGGSDWLRETIPRHICGSTYTCGVS